MKHLPRCPICGEAVQLVWDEAARTAAIGHSFVTNHLKGYEFKSPSRRETSAAWTNWVTKLQERRARWNQPMIWTAFNTRQVVAYCIAWQHSLCGIYSIRPNWKTKEPILCIEPADTMRGSSLSIPLNGAVIRVHSTWKYHNYNGKLTGHDQYIKVMYPEEWRFEHWAPPIFKEFKVRQDPKERVIDTPSLSNVLKLDRKAYFPHVQYPSMPTVHDGGLPIGAYTKGDSTYPCDYVGYHPTPEPWPNPFNPNHRHLFPPYTPMPPLF